MEREQLYCHCAALHGIPFRMAPRYATHMTSGAPRATKPGRDVHGTHRVAFHSVALRRMVLLPRARRARRAARGAPRPNLPVVRGIHYITLHYTIPAGRERRTLQYIYSTVTLQLQF